MYFQTVAAQQLVAGNSTLVANGSQVAFDDKTQEKPNREPENQRNEKSERHQKTHAQWLMDPRFQKMDSLGQLFVNSFHRNLLLEIIRRLDRNTVVAVGSTCKATRAIIGDMFASCFMCEIAGVKFATAKTVSGGLHAWTELIAYRKGDWATKLCQLRRYLRCNLKEDGLLMRGPPKKCEVLMQGGHSLYVNLLLYVGG